MTTIEYGPSPLKPLNSHFRHGFDEDQESLNQLIKSYYIHFDDKRHNTNGNPIPEADKLRNKKHYNIIDDWKIQKLNKKTVTAGIVLCLNIGVDPPDILKTYPCAKLECFIDPTNLSDSKKNLELIGKSLQSQYESLSLRTRYKSSLDPSVEDIKRFCNNLRRNAKDERILFHYNGHGVPQPTQSGEIWVFNRGYTQYIPISLYDLQTWLGAPCIYVYDCNSAGNIINNFKKFVQKRIDDDNEGNHDNSAPSPTSSYIDCIQLAACKSNEILPMNPELPADLFTCCLTCPIDISIKWFIMQSPLKENYDKLLRNSNGNIVIPGKLTDRRTPLGELNWIFTAITDTIAWTSLSRPIFKKLFRQDLMVAALFRNFLLAKRILPLTGINPISDPPLPNSINNHHMWQSWDLAIDQVLNQLIAEQKTMVITNNFIENNKLINQLEVDFVKTYKNLSFFQEQLTAFELYLKYNSNSKTPPEQLPIVLQVLLSQVHRLRALILLSKFLDLGPWAVYLSLSIGIFPYVLKLLQSPAQELKPVLIFIWARIMSIDHKNIQQELCKDKSYNYFYLILISKQMLITDDHKAMSAFILTLFIKDFKNGQRLCFSTDLINTCLAHIETSENPLLRQWCCLLLSQVWLDYPDGRWLVYKEGLVNKLIELANDPIPEVRTSIILALTNFLGNDRLELKQFEIKLTIALLKMNDDGSPIVRKQLIIFLSKFVENYPDFFIIASFSQLEEEITLIDDHLQLDETRKKSPSYGTIFSSVWKCLLILAEDPYLEVQQFAGEVVDFVMMKLRESELGEVVREMESYLLNRAVKPVANNGVGSPMMGPKDTTAQIHHFGGRDGRRTRSQDGSSRNNETNGDSESLSMRLKNSLSISNFFKSFQKINEDINFTKGLKLSAFTYTTASKPKTPRLVERDLNVAPILPTNSNFLDYSIEFFQEPQMSKNELDEPGSKEYMKRIWRRNRNEQIIQETQPQKELAIRGDWSKNVSFIDNKTMPKLLRFQQFEKSLIVSDDKDIVNVWDWETKNSKCRFSNGNPFGSKITDLKLLNEDDLPLLMTGSSDGVIKIYKNFDDESQIELISSWRALTDLLLTSKITGLISDWQQTRGSLLVSGDVKIIRVWDAPRELCVVDIPARSSSSITSITSDQVSGDIFTCGFNDGTVRCYDRRLDSRDSMIKKWDGGRSSIKKVHMQRGGFRELVSGNSDGQVKLWDIRLDKPVVEFQTESRIRTLDIHEHAPIIATGCKTVDLWTTSGDLVNMIKNPYNYLPNRTSSYLNEIVLHPHRMMLATNYNHDSHISIYSCGDTVQNYY